MNRIKMMLIAALLSLSAIASAGVPAWEWTPKYMGEIHIGYGTSGEINGVKAYMGRAMLGTLQGMQISNYLSAAFGVDAVMMTHRWDTEDMRFAINSYFDVRGYYPVTDRFAPFLDLGLGAQLHVQPWESNTPYFFCQFGPGIKYRKFVFSCGLQQLDIGDNGLTTFYVKTGISF